MFVLAPVRSNGEIDVRDVLAIEWQCLEPTRI
jgi:hypothetical protein